MNRTFNRKFGRYLAVFMAAVMICGSFVSFGAESFSDMSNSPYKDAVLKLTENKVINGYEDGTFRAYNNITRAEICVVIAKAMNPDEEKYESAGENSFTDVGDGYGWAEKYINYTFAMKAVSGYPDGSFKPQANITYNELSAMILKGLGYSDSDLSGKWPDNYKNKAIELGLYNEIFALLSDKQQKDFDYEAPATRGDSALMISQAFDRLKLRGKEKFPEGDAGKGTPVYEDGRYTWISGDARTLTLGQAIELMQTEGYLAETAKLNKEKDKGIVEGYTDSVKDLKDAIKLIKDTQSKRSQILSQKQQVNSSIGSLENMPEEERPEDYNTLLEQQKQTAQQLEAALTQIEAALDQMGSKSVLQANKDVVELQRDFAKENIEKNYEADMNSIEYQTVSIYYGILQAKENLAVTQDNLDYQKKLLENLKLKLSVGKSTNIEVNAQELAVKNAEQSVKEAKSALEKAKMNFNMLLGYEIIDNVELIDTLTPLELPEVDFVAAADKAFKNRLSVVQLDYACEVQKLSLEAIRLDDGKDSGAYEKQETALALTQYTYDNMPKTLEIEIRSAYIALANKYDTVTESQKTLEVTKDALKAAELLYQAGMGTAADVQKAQVSVFQTNQLLMASIADYNLAVYEFGYMTGVGKERIEL